MRSTFYGLEVARSGLYTAQNELNVTGHNISNVDTLGYTRQRLSTQALPALSMNVQIAIDTHSTAGRGVTATTVEQIRSAFTDAKYRMEASAAGFWTIKDTEFSMVEQLMNNMLAQGGSSGMNIHNAVTSFFAALNELAKKDNSSDIRQVVLDAGINLSESINYLYGKLEEQHNNINTAIAFEVDRMNAIATSIANLNKQIFGYELSGSIANDLRDQRNLLLDELSGIVDIEYFTNAKGQMVVTIGGRELVSGADSYKLVVDPYGADNQLDVEAGQSLITKQYTICWADALGNPGTKPEDKLRFSSGELKAYFEMRDGSTEETMGIPYVVRQLNELCRKIAREINEIHRQGYTMPYTVESTLGSTYNPDFHVLDPVTGEPVVNADGVYVWENATKETDPITGMEYYPSRQGVDFFYAGATDDYRTITGKNFRLSDEILNNTALIAASIKQIQIPDTGWPDSNQFMADTDNINNMLALRDKKDALGKDDSFESKIKDLAVLVANNMSHVISMQKAQEVRMNAVVEERASTSAVSIDDEMTNIIRYQHAYNASARVITAIDEELDTLINKMGLVGR